MKPILLYILQVIISSGILYTYYHFFLRNNKFHQYNRYYLLLATLASIIIPFLNIPIYFTEEDALPLLQSMSMYDYTTVVTAEGVKQSIFTTSTISYMLYAAIAIVILFRLLSAIYKIVLIKKHNPVQQLEDILFINTNEKSAPFSFFNWMFWNNNVELNSDKGQQMFRHELFHIRQKHSWDIIFMEFVTLFFWINPLFHLMKKEIKAIHEFLADEYAIAHNDKWDYTEMLLMQVFQTQNRLVQPFFNNQIKRRIAMITKSQQPKYQYLRKVLVLPIAAALVLLFAFTYQQVQAQNDFTIKEVSLREIEEVKPVAISLIALDSPKKKEPLIVIGNKVMNSITLKEVDPTTIQSVQVIKGAEATKLYGQQASDGAILVTLKEANEVVTVKGFRIDTTVNVQAIDASQHTNNNHVIVRGVSAANPTAKPLLVLNGEVKDMSLLQKINPNDIESIHIVKGKDATNAYGTRAENGVIKVFTKDNATAINTIQEVVVVGQKNPTLTVQGVKLVNGEDQIFTKAEKDPAFPGGANAWAKFLNNNLNAELPIINGAPAGTYRVMVKFIVRKDGRITNLEAETQHGFGMEEEALRLLKAGPNWEPAEQNGNKVNAWSKQPITFIIEETPVENTVAAAYPNPAKNNIVIPITSDQAQKVNVVITDLNGKTMKTQANNLAKGKSAIDVNISKLPAGTYVARVTDLRNRELYVSKFVKQ